MDDITFITMHDLTAEARLLYASDSITEVLGFDSQAIVGRSCFDYFHPDEEPLARRTHERGVQLDRASVLSYCRLRTISGDYVTCECAFTVVHSVIIASTSLYRNTPKSHDRAAAAPGIRRAFSSSAEDPRFHMLTHLSQKFKAPPPGELEPRAALILNRFTQTSAILYATRSLNEILGFELDQAVGMSFYECIQPDCLGDAISTIEQAKGNDSIAYLRFYWRDPTPLADDENGAEAHDGASYHHRWGHQSPESESVDASSRGPSVEPALEVEAVISCTSDGLVVVLRKAQPLLTPPQQPDLTAGFFVAPWALMPAVPQRTPSTAPSEPMSGPQEGEFLKSIQVMASFAWSLRSINKNLLRHVRKPGSTHEDYSYSSDGEKEPKRHKPNDTPSSSPEYEEGVEKVEAVWTGGNY